MKQFFLVVCIVFGIGNSVQAQLEFAPRFGGQLGVSFNIGSHFNRFGLIAKLYYQYEHIQANVQLAGYYNVQSFATKKPSWEGQMKLGLLWAFGPKLRTGVNPFLHEIGNQTGRAYSIGYSYNWYWDNIATSQATATFGFSIYDVRLTLENDFIAFQNEDKYRTGVMSLCYRYQNTQIAIKHAAWTGDPYAEGTSSVMDDSDFPSKYGYRAMADAPYSQYSAGIVAIGVEQYVGFGQYLGASIGIDAEEIRNFMQNEVIHESTLLKNPHIPMVTKDGKQYLHKEGQEIKNPQVYLQFIANGGNFF
jgi:hypothetical protein